MNDWKKKGVVYEIYNSSFNDTNDDGIGDIQGVIQKLDYLKELGVNILWLTPIFESPLVDNGYGFKLSKYRYLWNNGRCGGAEIKKSHDYNIKIVMDLVVNHTSDQHKWFQESKKSKDTNIVNTTFGVILDLMGQHQQI